MFTMRRLFTLSLIAFISICGIAQQPVKFAHINTQELIAAMPESDSAQAKIEAAYKDLQSQLEAMQVEFNNKYQDYQSKSSTYSDLIKQTKEAELQDLQQRIQQFQQNADQELQKTRAGIFKPILDKANKAISDVAKENNYTYVFDTSTGVVIYKSETSTDLLPIVKQKLGLK
jgi:outer membrane protein